MTVSVADVSGKKPGSPARECRRWACRPRDYGMTVSSETALAAQRTKHASRRNLRRRRRRRHGNVINLLCVGQDGSSASRRRRPIGCGGSHSLGRGDWAVLVALVMAARLVAVMARSAHLAGRQSRNHERQQYEVLSHNLNTMRPRARVATRPPARNQSGQRLQRISRPCQHRHSPADSQYNSMIITRRRIESRRLSRARVRGTGQN